MIKVNVIGLNETLKKLDQLSEQVRDKALVSAINKTADQTRNFAVKKIRAEYMLTSGDAKAKIRIMKASKNYLSATVYSFKKHGGMLLTKYSVRMTKKGMSVKVKKAGGRKIISKAFVTPSGIPFQRTGVNHYPTKGYWAGRAIMREKLKSLYGPSISDIFDTKEMYKDLTKFASDTLVKTFLSELRYYTNRTFNR